ncbi:MAG: universal stress protein [Hyphomicrobiales bacterium]|nr:universal stress protein [Hyphomicrobiales bacterium]
MPNSRKRRVFEDGHRRKFLVIADESKEVEAALYYAASRSLHTASSVVLLYVIEPDNQFWGGVRQVQIEEETNKAKALFRLFRRKLNNAGFESVETEEVVREGEKVDQILDVIETDEDVAVLTLGAAADAKGPGPLVSSLAAGSAAGSFPIPITIVPGDLTIDDIKALA